MGIAHDRRPEQALDGVVDIGFRNAVVLQIVLIDGNPDPFGRLAVAVVDIDDKRDPPEDLFQLGGDRPTDFRRRSIDFRKQGCQNRRSGRHLDHLERRALRHLHTSQPFADLKRDVVAGPVALPLRQKVDLQVALLLAFTQEIMAHQTIEIERCRRSGVALDRDDLGDIEQAVADLGEDPVGVFQNRAFRKVGDDLDFRFVVEGQQLDGHVLGIDQPHGSKGRRPHEEQKDPGPGFRAQDRGRNRAIDPAQSTAIARFAVAIPVQGRLARGLQHKPRGQDHRNEEGKQHGRRGNRRNRAHVGAHQPGDEHHRQERCNNGQGRHHRRIADFRDRLYRRLDPGPAILHCPMPGNVLDHDNRIVDQDTDCENEREQTDAVDGVAHELCSKERQKDRGRNDDEDDDPVPPADGNRHQDNDR